MAINSSIFLVSFGIFLPIYFLVWSRARWRLHLMLAANLGFYAATSWHYLPLLVGLGLLSYWCAHKIQNEPAQFRRRVWLGIPILGCLVALIFFKMKIAGYYNGTLQYGLFDTFPLGLSYFSFQIIGYTIDVYRGATEACTDWEEYLTAISFFPSIGAGPIVRTKEILPQLKAPQAPTAARFKWALLLIANGFFKKTIADLLLPAVQGFIATIDHSPILCAWTGIFALAGQFYADFSGYSDIAIGVAYLMGVQLPENFRVPYFASTVAEHWRRWHISLYDWFRDYVFQPLVMVSMRWGAASSSRRRATLLSAAAIIITMTLVGAWHGFGASFLIWGAINGLLICVTPLLWFSRGWFGIFLTFMVTAIIRVLMVAEPRASVNLWKSLFAWKTWNAGSCGQASAVLIISLCLVLPHLLDFSFIRHREFWRTTPLAYAMIFVFILVTVALGRGSLPFLYMRF